VTILDELLALFPDNTTGDISAADMRQAMTLLAGNMLTNSARITAVERETPTLGISVSGLWQLYPEVNGVPGNEQATCDTGSFGTATVLNLNNIAQGGTNWRNNLLGAASIYAQQQTNPDNWIKYTVRATPTDHGTWVAIPVTVADGHGVAGTGLWNYGVFVIMGSP